MATLVRAANGQFVAQTFDEKYPTGRKHCACCSRWRHLIDFSPAKWLDAAKTIPYRLLAYCRACVAAKQRKRTGHKLRTVFDGQVGTMAWKLRRAAKKREHYRKLRQDPVWVQARRDYYNRRSRKLAYAAWGYPPPDPELDDHASGRERFSAVQFAAYLDRWVTKLPIGEGQGGNQLQAYLNGFPLSDNEGRRLRSWRDGEYKHVILTTCDRWSVQFDLPFWEITEAAAA